jgi:hypothetical protein
MKILLERILLRAEARFGPRTKGWIVDKVIADRSSYPETIAYKGSGIISVHMTSFAVLYAHQRIYQIAHESIHCLVASGRRDTNYFEEGLANDFALTFPDLPPAYLSEALEGLPNLLKPPLAAFRALNPKDEAIRALRDELPNLEALEPSHIEKYFDVSDQRAIEVCKRMPLARPPAM